MISVLKGIPIPATMRRGGPGPGRPNIYPFTEMSVGDSFDVDADRARSVGASAIQWAKRHKPNARFTVRRISENKARVWRIS